METIGKDETNTQDSPAEKEEQPRSLLGLVIKIMLTIVSFVSILFYYLHSSQEKRIDDVKTMYNDRRITDSISFTAQISQLQRRCDKYEIAKDSCLKLLGSKETLDKIK